MGHRNRVMARKLAGRMAGSFPGREGDRRRILNPHPGARGAPEAPPGRLYALLRLVVLARLTQEGLLVAGELLVPFLGDLPEELVDPVTDGDHLLAPLLLAPQLPALDTAQDP